MPAKILFVLLILSQTAEALSHPATPGRSHNEAR
jgi:hypothetical protein